MADDTTGGTVLGFPGLTVPGVVGEGGLPALAPLTTEFTPPASLAIPENPALGGESESAALAMGAAPAAGPGSLASVAAMSTVMMAGITVAALRGAYHAVGYLKARAEHFKAVRDQQEAVTGKANSELEKARAAALGAQQKGRIQTGPEFGRTTKNPAPNSAPNSGRTNTQTPATFKPGPPPKPVTDPGKKPETGRKGSLDSRTGPTGTGGAGKVQDARRQALEAAGKSGRPDRNSGPGNTPGSRSGKTPAGPDTIRGAARQRAADRILNGPRDKQPVGPDKPSKDSKQPKGDKRPAGPDTIRGAARQRAADRITTGTWKPAGAHSGGGATPTTIRGAARKRVVDRILNGKKPKAGKDDTAKAAEAGPAAPGTDLAVRPDPAKSGPGAGTTSAGSPKGAGAGRVFTPGGTTGSRPWRLRRPGTTRPRDGQSKERKERSGRQTRERAERTNTRRTSKARKARDSGAQQSGPGTAGAGTGGFGPPPGWVHTDGLKVRRADRPDPDADIAGAIGRGPAALPRAPYSTPHARPGTTRPTPPTPPAGGPPVTVPAPRPPSGTQYADSDLTIGDVIEADADMAEEILQGADDARLAAEGCEKLLGRLEALHARVIDLKVPGVLESMLAALIEKTEEVKAKAEAVAETIPAAAEAIAQAGHNAERRDKPVADVVRDQGHSAPAERQYHDQ